MKRTGVTAVVALCGVVAVWGQILPPAGKTQGPGVQAAANAREADYLKRSSPRGAVAVTVDADEGLPRRRHVRAERRKPNREDR